MRIGVVGTVVKDRICLADGKEIRSLGGIYYTLSMLGNLLGADDEICPVCLMGEDVYDEIVSRLASYKNINPSGIRKVAQKNTTVKLVYRNLAERDEYLSHRLPELTLKDLRKIGDMDVWLVNFITGFEMNLDTWRQFREQVAGLVLMDFHSLSLDIKNNGLRVLRRLPDWQEWVRGVDVLQMNEAEAGTLTNREKASERDLIEFGKQVIQQDIKIFHITRGAGGSLLFFRTNGQVEALSIPSHPVPEVVDVTGCGDAFAAGFLVHYSSYGDVVTATRFANIIAGVNCTIRGTEELVKLKIFLRNYKIN